MFKKILSFSLVFLFSCLNLPSASAKLILKVASTPPVVDANAYTLRITTTPGAKVIVTGGITELPPLTDSDNDGQVEITVGLIQNSKNTFSIRAEKEKDSSDTVQIIIKEDATEALLYSQSTGADITPPVKPTLDEYLDLVDADILPLTGLAEANSTIIATKTDGTKITTTIAKSNQTFSLNVPLEQNKRNRINIFSRDKAGNTSLAVQAIIEEKTGATSFNNLEKKTVLVTETDIILEDESDNNPDIAKPFTDTANHWAKEYIKTLRLAGIVKGKKEGVFAPDDFLTRAELTKIALNSFEIQTAELTENPFGDVDKNIWYAPFIAKAKSRGIIQGYQNGFFPNQNITRAEAIKVLINTAEFEIMEGESGFSDIETGAWYDKYIAFAKNNGIVSGYTDGTFRPNAPITRGEIAKITVKTMELYSAYFAKQILNQATENSENKTSTGVIAISDTRVYENTNFGFSLDFYKNWYYETTTGSGDTIIQIGFSTSEDALANAIVKLELKNKGLDEIGKMNLATETTLNEIRYFINYNSTKHIEIVGNLNEKDKIQTMVKTLKVN